MGGVLTDRINRVDLHWSTYHTRRPSCISIPPLMIRRIIFKIAVLHHLGVKPSIYDIIDIFEVEAKKVFGDIFHILHVHTEGCTDIRE